MKVVIYVTFVLATLIAGPVQAGCLIFCDEGQIAPADARADLQAELGVSLPAGVTVVSMQEGGFQDAFIEVELTGTVEGLNELLVMMRIDPADLAPMTGEGFGATADPVWSLQTDTVLRGAEGWLGHFAYARAAVTTTPDKTGQLRLFIFAFET